MCGISEDKSILYEGVHKSKGFVSVCRKCYFRERIPIVDKKDVNLERINDRGSVRERLSKIAGIKVEKKEERRPEKRPEDVTLRDIVERNFKSEARDPSKTPEDLIENFNWVVMRKRRSFKITKEKLAEELKEPLIAIESLEKGVLPKDYKTLIKKVEGRLEIRLFKERNIDHNDILVESKLPSGILIEDLKKKTQRDKENYIDISNLSLDKINEVYGVPAVIETKEEKSKEIVKEKPSESIKEEKKEEYFTFKNPFKGLFSKKPSEKLKNSPTIGDLKDKKDLTDEEISKLVWGK